MTFEPSRSANTSRHAYRRASLPGAVRRVSGMDGVVGRRDDLIP
jgi:hypothetical protein